MNQQEYYQDLDYKQLFDKLGISFFKFRQLRVITQEGKVVKVRDQVNNPQDLKKIFLRYDPIKAYYQVGRFLNCIKVNVRNTKGRSGYVIADNLFLDQDIMVIDLDKNPVWNYWKLKKFCKEKELKIKYAIFSGAKGIHVCIERKKVVKIENPIEREKYFIFENKQFSKQLKAYGIEFDDWIENTRGIVKIPLSLSEGNVCNFIETDEDLKKLSFSSSAIGNEMTDNRRKKSDKEATELPSLSKHKAITNVVLGVKRNFILFLKYKITQLDEVEKSVKRLINKFNLSDCMIFERSGIFYVVCLKIMQKRRIEKILKYDKNLFANSFVKYKKNYIELENLNYMETLEGNKNLHISKAHAKFFNVLHPYLSGNTKVKFVSFTR